MLEKRKKSNKLEFSFLEGAQAVCFSQFVHFTLFKFVFVNERLYKVDTFERKSSSSSLLLIFSSQILKSFFGSNRSCRRRIVGSSSVYFM